MKTLLEFIIQYVGILYLNPKYRITNSSNRGLPDIDASISFTGDQLRWDVVNDRGLINFIAVPALQTTSDDWFALPLIRQYLEGGDDTGASDATDQANWLSANLQRVEELFADQSAPQAFARSSLPCAGRIHPKMGLAEAGRNRLIATLTTSVGRTIAL